jgi:AmiR/NasT family two-component response regulator
MSQQRCTAEDAFFVLVRLSQTTHRKLRDVAAGVVDEVSKG